MYVCCMYMCMPFTCEHTTYLQLHVYPHICTCTYTVNLEIFRIKLFSKILKLNYTKNCALNLKIKKQVILINYLNNNFNNHT